MPQICKMPADFTTISGKKTQRTQKMDELYIQSYISFPQISAGDNKKSIVESVSETSVLYTYIFFVIHEDLHLHLTTFS